MNHVYEFGKMISQDLLLDLQYTGSENKLFSLHQKMDNFHNNLQLAVHKRRWTGNNNHSWQQQSFLATTIIPGNNNHSWQQQSFLATTIIPGNNDHCYERVYGCRGSFRRILTCACSTALTRSGKGLKGLGLDLLCRWNYKH